MTRKQLIRHAISEARRRQIGKDELPKGRTKPIAHGTNAGYVAKCRCVPCTVAHTAYCREWLQKRRTAA